MRCGLLGRRLGHSYSPAIHELLGEYSYQLFQVEPEQLGAFLKNGDFTGINVTMPYKQAVIPFLDEITPIAQKLGAVNTVVRKNGRLIGHNTDYAGFQYMLQRSGLTLQGKKALVLGSGGASRTCVAVLEELGARVTVISRSGADNYDNLDIHADLLVNTTPVGMYPDTGRSPVALSRFTQLEAVLDVVYNPVRTKLLMDAASAGIPAFGGLSMLVAQAKEASQWFTGRTLAAGVIPHIEDILRRQMENIILVGMPGCGKSTVGQALAQALQRPFMDLDAVIAEKAQMSVPELLSTYGEDAFRQLETEAAAEICKCSGLVIATGGGIVTQMRNYPLLHQNGSIFWLQRPVRLLATGGRPLSVDLQEMYEKRRSFYESFQDFTVDNSGTMEETLAQILKLWEDLL